MLAPKTVQRDFSAGACPSYARHLIPENGVFGIENGLLDADGGIYKRGGSEHMSTSDFGTTGLRWLWDGYFKAGRRTFFANSADFGVLDAAEAPVNLGGAGLSGPASAAMLGDLLFVGGGVIYAGSRKTSDYSTGTVALNNGSAIVTGTGTSWTANVDAGMIFRRSGERVYVVQSVDSDTQVTLTEAYGGATGTGIAYTLKALEAATTPYRTSDTYAVAGQRLISCEGGKFYFSDFDNPHVWQTDNNWELPEGVDILGASGVENVLRILTTDGIWQAENLHFEAVDDFGNPQHNLQQVTKDILLWSAPGMATWAGNLIVPSADGVWMIGGSTFERISKSIDRRYADHIAQGRQAGQAVVFRGHYFLPVLESDTEVVEVLVCRLDRPTKARGQTIYPWSWQNGSGANATACAVRVSNSATRAPKLLAAGRQASGRVLDITGFFTPSASNKTDHDATTPDWSIETRDYPTGALTKGLAKAMRLGYRLIDGGSDNPVLYAEYSDGQQQQSGSFYGSAFYGSGFYTAPETSEWLTFTDTAPEDDGREPKFWRLRRARARTRYIRFRIRSYGPSAECTLRSIELFTRQSGRK